MYTLFSLLACGGHDQDVKLPEPPPPELAPPPVVPEPPSVVATPAPGTRAFALDTPGGSGGAADGMAFIVPPGALVETALGPLSDGSTGMRLTARGEGDALMCTESVPLRGAVSFGTRMKVIDVKPGPQGWMGLNVELRARDATGALVSAGGTRYVLLRNDRAPTDWITWDVPVTVPEGATNGEFCYRFVNSTGTVEVDQIEVSGAPPAADPGAPVGTSPGDAAAGAPSPAAPLVDGSSPPLTRWSLDSPGGGGGAPLGFEFLIPPGTTGTTAETGPVAGGLGLRLTVGQPANSLACSDAFPVSGAMRVGARVRVAQVKADARPSTGFVAEVRTYDAAGALVSPPGTRFVPVATLRSAGDWQQIGQTFATPTGAATGKFCFRFVESTGEAEVDWAEAGPG